MTAIRWSAGKGVIFMALALGILLPFDIKSTAKPGETSVGISEQRLERQELLVELAFKRAIKVNREKVPTELALPSGLPEATPQPDPSFTGGVDNQEEISFLIELYAAKYGIESQTLEEIAKCESRYNPEATGESGERGLTQFLHSTWLDTPQARFGWDAAYHPAINIEAAAWMLSQGRTGEFYAIPCS